jgi:uncharacterized protein (DUF952 family)
LNASLETFEDTVPMNPPLDAVVYKIAAYETWDAGLPGGRYEGSPDDVRDGFIHLSTATQVRETVAKYFAGRTDLILAAVDVAKLGDTLKWEASRGGQLFPHVYGPILAEMVLWTKPLALRDDGAHAFPTEID